MKHFNAPRLDNLSMQSSYSHWCAPLMPLLFIFLFSSPATAFVTSPSLAKTPKHLHFSELIPPSTRTTNHSDFSVALQSRILNLLTQQLIENTNNKLHDSLMSYPLSYKTNTFEVNILADMNNKIIIEIHDHGMRSPEIIEISYQ